MNLLMLLLVPVGQSDLTIRELVRQEIRGVRPQVGEYVIEPDGTTTWVTPRPPAPTPTPPPPTRIPNRLPRGTEVLPATARSAWFY